MTDHEAQLMLDRCETETWRMLERYAVPELPVLAAVNDNKFSYTSRIDAQTHALYYMDCFEKIFARLTAMPDDLAMTVMERVADLTDETLKQILEKEKYR